MINRAWNQSASFRLTQWLKIISHMTRSYYCNMNQSIFSHCVRVKLGHRFHTLLKVCSHRDNTAPLNNNLIRVIVLILVLIPYIFLYSYSWRSTQIQLQSWSTRTHEEVLDYNYRVGVLVLMKKYSTTTIELEYSYSWRSTRLQL